MSSRLIFSIKCKNEVLAYLYQNWGAGDGTTVADEVKKAAKKYNLDLTSQSGAISALRIAGESVYGHAKWNGHLSQCKDKLWRVATKPDRDYLKAHRDELIADNQDDTGFVFYYGVSSLYVDYIYSWCEDAYVMNV